MASVSDLKALPNLPGFSIPEFKEAYPKPGNFQIKNGQRIETKAGFQEKTKFVKVKKPAETWRTGSLPESSMKSVFKHPQGANASEHRELPAWDAFDRHVLRFMAFFKEAVVETNLENFRVRKIAIYYYLEDDTCLVNEPRQDNSGIPQGTLIRRHRFPGPDGGYLKPEDLQVGSTLQLYGRTMYITDCDAFTRNYYEQMGQEQGPPVESETDPFLETREAVKAPTATQPRSYEKIYREVMLGGGHLNEDMQQFIENDGKVLRFFAIMDDVSTPQFERRPFIILYFLADDKVEVREQYPLNCGRDNFPIFFRKGRMPANDISVLGPQSQPRKRSEYVNGHDFYVGMRLKLMNSEFFIYDADDFTRGYFKQAMNLDLDPKIEVQLPERTVPRASTPPYTGYGTWEDSMGSVTHLVPKQPQKDAVKLFAHSGKVLRFKAKFNKPKPEDVDRLFVVSYFLEDDTLSIHEPPQRNLGIVTGRFLEKSVHMNQVTGKIFQMEDLLPGHVIKIYNHEFVMLDCDEFSKKLMIDKNRLKHSYDLEAVLQKIRESLRQQYPLVRDVFRRFDTDHDGVLTFGEFKKCLQKFSFVLGDEETLQIMKHFDSRQDGQVSYNEFCDALLEEDFTGGMLATKPGIITGHDADYQEKAARKAVERGETVEVKKAVRALGDVLYKKHGVLYKLFREFKHYTHEECVSCTTIQMALRGIGHTFELADIQRAVLWIYPDADLESVNYLEFFKGLQSTFHDTPTER
jgi:Ca2+-binding EF-hand superfamily protein